MVNALVGCDDCLCGPIVIPQNTHNLAPFVRVKFATTDLEITVGNESFPAGNNSAIIKSMEFGTSDGTILTLEIIDEQGGSFSLFVDKLPKKLKDFNGFFAEVTWGWVQGFCGDEGVSYDAVPTVKVSPQKLSVDYTGGQVKYTIACTDMMQAVFTARPEKALGADDQKMHLKDAIEALFKDSEPATGVSWLRKNSDGSVSTWGFEVGGDRGPKAVWTSDNQNKLAVAMEWLKPYRTDRKKGIVCSWDYFDGSTIIFWEDGSPDCKGEAPCNPSIGTFIVNGGNLSNVINFTPEINWTVAFASFARGGGLGPGSGEKQQFKKNCADPGEEAGIQQTVGISRHSWDVHGPGELLKETDKAMQAHNRAEIFFSGTLSPIKAELTIQGTTNPGLISPILSKFTTCAIVVINPFHLKKANKCYEWLAEPACNEVLTNKKWQIDGISHRVAEGTFTTTLHLFLAVPNIHFPDGTPLGGPGSCGYSPGNRRG